jgi:hypothetical protein
LNRSKSGHSGHRRDPSSYCLFTSSGTEGLLTLRWRKRDSNSRSRITNRGVRRATEGACVFECSACGWDQQFESPLLQRGVGCELDFLNHGRRRPFVCHDMAFSIWVGLSSKETRSRGWESSANLPFSPDGDDLEFPMAVAPPIEGGLFTILRARHPAVLFHSGLHQARRLFPAEHGGPMPIARESASRGLPPLWRRPDASHAG